MVIVRIIVGLVVMAACVALMKYSVQVTNFTGKIDMAEKYLGNPLAGTYTFYRLFAVLIMILMVLWIFGKLTFLPFS
jgi:hypothetical protein